MKKKIMYLIIPVLFFMGMYDVNAAEGATCVYSYTIPTNNVTQKIKCEIDENKVDCKMVDSSGNDNKYISEDYSFTPLNFQVDKKWKCKSQINAYAVSHGMSGSSTYYLYLPEVTCDKCDRNFSLVKSESKDGGAVSGESPIGDENSLNCQYGKLIITYNKDKGTLTHNDPCSRTVLHFGVENLSDCPDELWGYSYQGTCNYYLQKQNAGGWIELNSDDPIPDADGDDKSGNTPPEPGEKSSGCGILGGTDSKTVQLLSWVMKIIRLGVPILIIILGMIDFLQILFSGEDKVFKDAFGKFVKRLIIGVCIIFIPYIIQLVIRLSGVDTQYGIDNFYCGIIDATSGVKIESEKFTSASSCRQAGYYWIPSESTCEKSLTKLNKSKNKCISEGYEWEDYVSSSSAVYGGHCILPMPSSRNNKNSCEKIGFKWVVSYNSQYGGYCTKK